MMGWFTIFAMFLNAGIGFYNGVIGNYSLGTYFLTSACCIYAIQKAVD